MGVKKIATVAIKGRLPNTDFINTKNSVFNKDGLGDYELYNEFVVSNRDIKDGLEFDLFVDDNEEITEEIINEYIDEIQSICGYEIESFKVEENCLFEYKAYFNESLSNYEDNNFILEIYRTNKNNQSIDASSEYYYFKDERCVELAVEKINSLNTNSTGILEDIIADYRNLNKNMSESTKVKYLENSNDDEIEFIIKLDEKDNDYVKYMQIGTYTGEEYSKSFSGVIYAYAGGGEFRTEPIIEGCLLPDGLTYIQMIDEFGKYDLNLKNKCLEIAENLVCHFRNDKQCLLDSDVLSYFQYKGIIQNNTVLNAETISPLSFGNFTFENEPNRIEFLPSVIGIKEQLSDDFDSEKFKKEINFKEDLETIKKEIEVHSNNIPSSTSTLKI